LPERGKGRAGEGNTAGFLLLGRPGARCRQRSVLCRDRRLSAAVAPSQAVKAHVVPVPVTGERESGDGRVAGATRAASVLPAAQLHARPQQACSAATASETAPSAFFRRMNRCCCVLDAPGSGSEHIHKLTVFLLFKEHHENGPLQEILSLLTADLWLLASTAPPVSPVPNWYLHSKEVL